MRIVVHGQQAFGKAVLEALIKRGESVIAVYVAPEKEGAKADPLKEAALAAKFPVFQPASYKDPKVWDEFKALKPDLQVMAFVTMFVPEEFLNVPTHRRKHVEGDESERGRAVDQDEVVVVTNRIPPRAACGARAPRRVDQLDLGAS